MDEIEVSSTRGGLSMKTLLLSGFGSAWVVIIVLSFWDRNVAFWPGV